MHLSELVHKEIHEPGWLRFSRPLVFLEYNCHRRACFKIH